MKEDKNNFQSNDLSEETSSETTHMDTQNLENAFTRLENEIENIEVEDSDNGNLEDTEESVSETEETTDSNNESSEEIPSSSETISLTDATEERDNSEKPVLEGESIFAADQMHDSKSSKIDPEFFADVTPSHEILAKKDKRKKVFFITLSILLIALLGAYIWGVIYYQNRFLPNTYIAGYNMSNQDLDDSLELLDTISEDRIITLVGKDNVESEVKASDIGLVLTESPDISQTLNEQNSWLWPLNLFPNNAVYIASNSTLDENALNEVINSLDIVSGDQVVKTENAKAEFDGNAFVLKDEVYGTEVNVDQLKENVIDGLLNGEETLNLQSTHSYVEPTVLSDNTTLEQSIENLNTVKDAVITYNFDIAQEVLDKNTFANWLHTDESGNVTIDKDQVAAYVASLADKYDTLEKTAPFTTTSGKEVDFTDWYSGWEINQSAETEELSNLILSGQTVTKDPNYDSTGRARTENNAVTGTYLEISIGSQYMWYYENGELIVSTPVVTGDPTAGHGTPTGLYYLQGKDTNVTLTDNKTYWSPVTFWMPFNGGIGVHDSSWRSSYGGGIYYGNGSHGCVNTPYSAVRTIYNNISVGTPVAVYY